MSLEMQNFGCWTRSDAKVNTFADSLNFWRTGAPLPAFVFIVNFDWAFSNKVYECVKEPENFSFRKAILDRVINEEVLEAIFNSKGKSLDSLYSPIELTKKYHNSIHPGIFPDIPYMKYTTRVLVKRRLTELRRKKALFGH
jgi:hypothetical protein